MNMCTIIRQYMCHGFASFQNKKRTSVSGDLHCSNFSADLEQHNRTLMWYDVLNLNFSNLYW